MDVALKLFIHNSFILQIFKCLAAYLGVQPLMGITSWKYVFELVPIGLVQMWEDISVI